MGRYCIDIGEQAFILVNGPVNVLSLAANIFFACCLIFPSRSSQRLKQPLKTLLEFLVICSASYCVSLAVLCFLTKNKKDFVILIVSSVVVDYFMHNSMTCYVRLNFYFYIQIVPAQRGFAIWVKRNIRSVIYAALLFDGMLFLSSAVIDVAAVLVPSGLPYNSTHNSTWTEQDIDGLRVLAQVFFFIIKGHILICLCIIIASSLSTARYLLRNMRRMAQSGSCCFLNPKTQRQMRVTISGTFQVVLYFLYYMFYLLDSFSHKYSLRFVFSPWVSFTVTSLYIFGTTVNMGIGQTIFRQRAADVRTKLKSLCGVGVVTNGVKSDETADAVTADVQM